MRKTDCYSADSQLLTRRGWLPFPELEDSDEVATASPAGELTGRPSAIQRYQFKGPMCHFAAKSLDLLVTPNHRMWLRRKHATQYAFHVAHEVLQSSSDSSYYALKNQLSWKGCYQRWFNVPSAMYKRSYCAKPLPAFDMGDWCEFMGWYLSEGCTARYRDRYEVHIAQQKPSNLPKITALLTNMVFTFHYNQRTFVICNRQLTEYLASFGKAGDKYIARELLELSPVYLARLYGSLLAGDGHEQIRVGRRPGHIYKTTSDRLAGDVQELLLKLGHSASVNRVSATGRERWRPSWAITRRTSAETTIFPSKHAARVPYDGWVYCCTVEAAPYAHRETERAPCGV